MDVNELKKTGFSHRYIPKLKKVDDTLSGYCYLFKTGNCISIDLRYVDVLNEWVVNHINIEGNEALQYLDKDLCFLGQYIVFTMS